jgi:serine/threonine protein kinase
MVTSWDGERSKLSKYCPTGQSDVIYVFNNKPVSLKALNECQRQYLQGGSFSEVFSVKIGDNIFIAEKQMTFDANEISDQAFITALQIARREVYAAKNIHNAYRAEHGNQDHPNIVSSLGSVLVTNEDRLVKLRVHYEFAEKGDLIDYFVSKANSKEEVTIQQITNIFVNALSGLTYMHANGIVHRDVKLDNILIITDGVHKLADFGSVVFLNELNDDELCAECGAMLGTEDYIPPEMDRKANTYEASQNKIRALQEGRPNSREAVEKLLFQWDVFSAGETLSALLKCIPTDKQQSTEYRELQELASKMMSSDLTARPKDATEIDLQRLYTMAGKTEPAPVYEKAAKREQTNQVQDTAQCRDASAQRERSDQRLKAGEETAKEDVAIERLKVDSGLGEEVEREKYSPTVFKGCQESCDEKKPNPKTPPSPRM